VVGEERCTVAVFFLVVLVVGFAAVVVVFAVGAGETEVIFTGEDGGATPWVTEDAALGDARAVLCGDARAGLWVTGGGSGPIGTGAAVWAGPLTV
jgi:hypothetical protein